VIGGEGGKPATTRIAALRAAVVGGVIEASFWNCRVDSLAVILGWRGSDYYEILWSYTRCCDDYGG